MAQPILVFGNRFIADGQSAFFYPITWLFALLPIASAFGIISALHTFLAAISSHYSRAKTALGWEAALAGATAWMLGGVMVAWQMWQVVDATLCWIPLALYCVDRLLCARYDDPERSRRCALRATAGLAVATGMMLTAWASSVRILRYRYFGALRALASEPKQALASPFAAPGRSGMRMRARRRSDFRPLWTC